MDRVNGELPERIESALRALDARASARAARVNPERVAERVLERLRREGRVEPRRVWGMRPAVLRVAAAVVVIAAGVAVTLVREPGTPTAAVLPTAIPAMDSLSTSELEAVLEAAGELKATNVAPAAASNDSLDNLSEQQLQKVLASLEDVAS